MNTLEEAFLQSAAASLVVEDTAQAKAASKTLPTVAEMIGTPEQVLAPAKPETGAAIAKGMAQGFAGLPGDLISLARGVYELGKSGGDLDSFLAGLEKSTGLWTTEDVKKFLDEIGLKIGDGDMTAETVGEFAAPGGYVKAAKKAGRAVKKMTGAK
jgi:hypothetical protein